ncbi:MAG: hypothetical protein J0M12_05935 [Deltaproteobacteria bacterium]|nr:hypothetical protein [Deltaproteobacteria bacterium]
MQQDVSQQVQVHNSYTAEETREQQESPGFKLDSVAGPQLALDLIGQQLAEEAITRMVPEGAILRIGFAADFAQAA